MGEDEKLYLPDVAPPGGVTVDKNKLITRAPQDIISFDRLSISLTSGYIVLNMS